MSNSKIDRIKAKSLERMALFERENIDMDKRTVSIAFSSEEPVERWFGTEILDHSPNSVRLGRLRDGGPVLVGHDSRDHVGVIESVSIDQDRRGRALVRFGKSARAEEIFQDVVDGIRRSVSVGYRIHEAVLEKTSDSGDTYRVTDWEPYEVSIVSVPADATVGVGRSDDDIGGSQNETLQREEHPMPDKDKQTPPSAEDRQDPAVNVEEVRAKAREEEKARIRYIEQVGQKYDQPELARQFIENGRSMEEFNAALLERIGKSEDQVSTPVEVDMSDAEHREFSIVRALNASVTGDWSSAGLEREVSREIAKQLGRDTEGVFNGRRQHRVRRAGRFDRAAAQPHDGPPPRRPRALRPAGRHAVPAPDRVGHALLDRREPGIRCDLLGSHVRPASPAAEDRPGHHGLQPPAAGPVLAGHRELRP